MERLKFANKRIMLVFGLLFVTGIIGCMVPVSVAKIHHIPAFAYITMILIWAVSVRRRIVDGRIRTRILIACAFMLLLFILRMCKYSYFPDDIYVNEYVWYAYTIPLTAIPVCFFMAAINVEPVRNPRLVAVAEKALVVLIVIVAVVVMTNDYHSFVYNITVRPEKEYTHEWCYWVILGIRVLLSIGVLYVLMKKCSLSAAKKKWYIPAISIAASCILLTWYLIYGGAPKIMGYKLFQVQEAVCIPFIIAFESIIQIGLIPANSGYRRIFDHSGINACIYDDHDQPVIVAGAGSHPANTTEAGTDELQDIGENDDPGTPDIGYGDTSDYSHNSDQRICRAPISGGYITWVEDLSPVNCLNREIAEVTEELADENELIRRENEVRAERISYEERNRLYNSIASAVRTRAVRAYALLDEASCADDVTEDDQENIIYASVLSAYIKRMGNLILLSDRSDTLSSVELGASIRESLDYLKLNGCRCFIYENCRCELSSQSVLLAYELFEDAMEDAWSRLNAVSVSLDQEDDFVMSITMDAAAEAISSTRKDKELQAAGCRLSVKFEDDTYFIRMEICQTTQDTSDSLRGDESATQDASEDLQDDNSAFQDGREDQA